MSQDKELEIRRQFLDEAEDYLNTLDLALVGLSGHRADPQKINAALRAAHSIKGGAGMMGFTVLSGLAHRLEDSFKVLKIEQDLAIDPQLENLLLTGVDCLRQVIAGDRQARPLAPDWVTSQIEPVFDRLHQQLGDPQEENAASLLSPEDGQDIIPLLFETEVEGCLQRLEAVLEHPDQPCLAEELDILAQELGGLGEMLQLSAFVSLCTSVTQTLAEYPDQAVAIGQSALQTWRRSQALVMIGQVEQLPTAIAPLSPLDAPLLDRPDLISRIAAPMDGLMAEPLDKFVNKFIDQFIDESTAEPIIGPIALDQESPAGEFFPFALDPDSVDPIAVTTPLPNPGESSREIFTSVSPEHSELNPTTVESAISPALFDYDNSQQLDQAATQITDYKILEAKTEHSAETLEEDATVRLPVRQLNQLNDLFGELTIDRNGLDLYIKRLRHLTRTLNLRVKTLNQVNAKIRNAYDQVTMPTVHQTLPQLNPTDVALQNRYLNNINGNSNDPLNPNFDALELDQYNYIHTLSQQVMETIVQIQEITDDLDLSLDDTEQTSRTLNKTAKQLQTGLMQLRMRPLADIVDRFPRALRELSQQHGKQVKLEMSGTDTLVDRNILAALADPLMHLFRNAFDHGIEAPAVRRSRGKSETGVIAIQAQQQSSRTVITVQDDGEGIPLAKIRARATQMGLDATLLATASDADLLSLIFEPGFSTSDQVTTLSGRGVGMDVVRSNLREIRGEISVNTIAGAGTTFTLSLPFTLSVVHILLVESNGMLLAFPTDVIQEMFLLQPAQIEVALGSEVLHWHDQVVPLIRLHQWIEFNCPVAPHDFEIPPTIRSASVLIVKQGAQVAGLQIDRCWGEQEATLRRIEGSLPLPRGFSSCTILGDGRVVPLVNVPELLHWMTSYERLDRLLRFPTAPQLPQSTPALLPSAAATILIVDDSINVRRFLALTLERAGYPVEQAKDGQEALERLEAGLSVQAVICDIEMPRLDGYGFLAKIKANPGLASLPIAMLTSRSSSKHRQLATSLGATAYFTKPYNEQDLLRTLAEMTLNH
jgi:two-component system, chemotaxis family, sensor histidine kinase and response regulator PixL